MRVNYLITKVFIRQALLDSNGDLVVDADLAMDALQTLQLGNYTTATDSDTTLIATSEAGKTFQFQVTPGLSRLQITGYCEEAMTRIQLWIDKNAVRTTPLSAAALVPAIQAGLLTKRTRTRPNFC